MACLCGRTLLLWFFTTLFTLLLFAFSLRNVNPCSAAAPHAWLHQLQVAFYRWLVDATGRAL
jgi:hypothetical protein